jgi:hypothetical protein
MKLMQKLLILALSLMYHSVSYAACPALEKLPTNEGLSVRAAINVADFSGENVVWNDVVIDRETLASFLKTVASMSPAPRLAIPVNSTANCMAIEEMIATATELKIPLISYDERYPRIDYIIDFESYYDDIPNAGYKITIKNRESFAITCVVELSGHPREGKSSVPVALIDLMTVAPNEENSQIWRDLESHQIESSVGCDRK